MSSHQIITTLTLTPAQVLQGYLEAEEACQGTLRGFKVKLPKGDIDCYPDKDGIKSWTVEAVWLGIFAYHVGRYIRKDAISAWMTRTYGNMFGRDTQCRHLWESGWNLGGKFSRHPVTGEKMPKGCYCLYDLDGPSPKFMANARVATGIGAGRVVAGYGYCLTCLAEGGKPHPRFHDIVELRKAHKDPEKYLTASNTVPQCQFCNDPSKNDFVLNDRGLAWAVASPAPVLRASEKVQRLVFEELRHKYDGGSRQAVSSCPPTP